MANHSVRRWMGRFARLHIWLGWLIAVPLLLWTMSGVVMVLKPIEEVRGTDLRIERARQPLPAGIVSPASATAATELRTFVQRGRAVTLARDGADRLTRFDAASGVPLPPVDAAEARAAVREAITGGAEITALTAFGADDPPLDLRKPVPVWQATLADGAHVYVNRDSGEIEAVRTRWWRFYDVMWGLHIMDLRTREDAHNPFTLGFGTLAFAGVLLGAVLLFRRRKRVGSRR